jgi:hypothetical protein
MKQPNHRRAYPPISPHSWGRLLEYLGQAECHLQDPRAPEPDIRLLADAEHGPFVGIGPGVDDAGRPAIFFQKAEGTTQPRHAPPLVVLLWRVHIAFGGGGHPNDAGNGLSYVKIGSGHCKVTLMRLVLDAKPGETVRQKRGVPFRSQDPRNFYKTTARTLADEGKQTRRPTAGRSEVTSYSLDKFRKHRMRSGIAISEAEFLDALRRVYAAIDATYLDA